MIYIGDYQENINIAQRTFEQFLSNSDYNQNYCLSVLDNKKEYYYLYFPDNEEGLDSLFQECRDFSNS